MKVGGVDDDEAVENPRLTRLASAVGVAKELPLLIDAMHHRRADLLGRSGPAQWLAPGKPRHHTEITKNRGITIVGKLPTLAKHAYAWLAEAGMTTRLAERQ